MFGNRGAQDKIKKYLGVEAKCAGTSVIGMKESVGIASSGLIGRSSK